MRDIFCSFADIFCSFDEDAWTRARLPISDGGGGFGANLSDICHSAFAASFLAFANSNIGEKFNIKNVVLDVERGANVEISLVQSFVEYYRSLNAVDRDSFPDIFFFAVAYYYKQNQYRNHMSTLHNYHRTIVNYSLLTAL